MTMMYVRRHTQETKKRKGAARCSHLPHSCWQVSAMPFLAGTRADTLSIGLPIPWPFRIPRCKLLYALWTLNKLLCWRPLTKGTTKRETSVG